MDNSSRLPIIVLVAILVFAMATFCWFMYLEQSKPGPQPSEAQKRMAQYLKAGVVKSEAGRESLPYRLFVPASVNGESNKYPLIVILQASGGRGNDNLSHLGPTVSLFTSDSFQGKEPAFVLAPQCPSGVEWSDDQSSKGPPFENYNMAQVGLNWRQKLIAKLISNIGAEYPVDLDRVYLTGISMGATGAWEMLYRYPDLFAAAVILNGRSDPSQAETIGNTPIRMFHGLSDNVAPSRNSKLMYEALRDVGADVELTLLEAGHGIELESYTPELYRWLVKQRRMAK